MDFKLIKGGLAALGLGMAVAGAGAAQAAVDKDAIAERIAPVGQLCLVGEECGSASAAPAASTGGGAPDGEGIYGKVCSACHDTGAAGAPVRGNEGDWSARVDKGFDTLLSHAINGFNGMPAKGGNPSLSDEDMHAAVAYLVEPVMDVPEAESAPAEDAAAEAAPADDAQADNSAAEADASESTDTAEDTAAADEASAEEGGDAQAEDASAGGETAWASIDGEAIFNKACMACHATGAAGAPISGNAEQWASRIAKGKDTLYDHAINGFNAMPAKGGQPGLSDNEVKAAVDYMVAESQ